ncbi:unnamed protein product [Pleuronectes platessa]|uniref:Uncharacterized protein n=1 Tax=Pleuronectes platessa TaxID=8262 RepID=A0A9N7UEW7_PLEPL|nr:unnamed protein product [Pleuronectes platessa]
MAETLEAPGIEREEGKSREEEEGDGEEGSLVQLSIPNFRPGICYTPVQTGSHWYTLVQTQFYPGTAQNVLSGLGCSHRPISEAGPIIITHRLLTRALGSPSHQ